ncbi:MAG: S41 family peptidase [Clostridiales bacterium]|nr:S41 family peptidase [Clostridiales bacterium]
MNIKKSVFVIFLLVAALLGGAATYGTMSMMHATGGSVGLGKMTISAEEYNQLTYMNDKYAKAEELWKLVQKNFYQDITDEQIEEGMYKGIFQSTGDIYSSYMNEDEWKSWESSMTGEFEGVGVTFQQNEKGEYVVLSTVKDSPAQKAGLLPGDILTKVDGEEYEDSTQMSMAIRGDSGTTVDVTYLRDGKENTVTLTRTTIAVFSVESEMLEGNIGLIRITSFDMQTAEDFKTELKAMEAKGVKGLIIDLRNNGGGLVDQSVQIADMLLDKGTVMYTEDRQGHREYTYSEEGRTSLPYVILVNENSASAAEILSAAIKDNAGGKLVGTVTFGKGIIQNSAPLGNGTGYKLTVLQYFSPNGNKIHGVGVTPDYIVEGDDEQLKKAIELLK